MSKYTFVSKYAIETHYDSPTKAHAFYDFLCGLNQLSALELQSVIITCDGNPSNISEATVAALAGITKFEEKRATTHRQITVHNGASSCANAYTRKWIRK